MFELRYQTPPEWASVALTDFPTFLNDHASCERKASAVGMSFVVRYPDRGAIIDPMIHFAREELEHFHCVFRLMQSRGVTLAPDEEDPYVNRLMERVRTGRDERFLDRLVCASVIEARGHERLERITAVLQDAELITLYARLSRAEKSHKDLFLGLAGIYFPMSIIRDRLDYFLDLEAESISKAQFRCAIH